MSTHTSLRLVDTSPQDVLPFDRRDRSRRTVNGVVTAMQSHTTAPDGKRNRICTLKLLNMSGSGLGAEAPVPIEIDSAITVYIPPHGPERGVNLYGQVVRCTPRGKMHEIGVRLDARTAA